MLHGQIAVQAALFHANEVIAILLRIYGELRADVEAFFHRIIVGAGALAQCHIILAQNAALCIGDHVIRGLLKLQPGWGHIRRERHYGIYNRHGRRFRRRLLRIQVLLGDPSLDPGGKIDAVVPVTALLVHAELAPKGQPGAHIGIAGGLAHDLGLIDGHPQGLGDLRALQAAHGRHDRLGGQIRMGGDHGTVAARQLRVGKVEFQDVRIGVPHLGHVDGALVGDAHPRTAALAPAQEPAIVSHLGHEADVVVG